MQEKATADQQARLRAQIEKLARAYEPKALAENSDVLLKARVEHATDVAAYKFKVVRWGDWLEVSMARQSEGKIQKFSTSINLKLVTTIRIEEGHGPDQEGELTYESRAVKNIKDKEDDGIFGGGPCGDGWTLYPVAAGYHLEIAPKTPQPETREMFEEIKPPTSYNSMNTIYCGYGDRVELRTPHYARYAKDDVIYFDGIATLNTPAGLGKGIFHKILAAKDSSSEEHLEMDGVVIGKQPTIQLNGEPQ
jgi:hypothetical protein